MTDGGELLEPIPAKSWLVLGVCSATVMLTLLDSGMLFVAFPFVEERFADAASRTTVSWVVTSFFVVMVSTLLVSGRVADRFGRRRVFLTGLMLFAVAALVAATTNNLWTLIGARVFQGLAVALLAPSSLALMLPKFPETRRAYALGVVGTIGASFGLGASPLGAVVVNAFGWRGVFVLTGIVAGVLAIVGVIVLDDAADDNDSGPIDVLSSLLVTVAVAGLAIVLVEGSDWGWLTGRVAATSGIALVAAAWFWIRNSRQDPPLVDPAIFANRRFAVASVASVASQLGFFSAYFGIPLFMAEVWGWSPLKIGLGLLPLNAIPVLVAAPAGRMVDRYGPRGMIAAGGVFTALCFLAIGFWLSDAGYLWLAIGMAASGLGAVAMGNNTTVAALRDIDDATLGTANAGYFMTRRLGSALGAVAVPAIVGNRTGASFADAYVWVWVFGAIAYVIGGLAVWLLYPPWNESHGGRPQPIGN